MPAIIPFEQQYAADFKRLNPAWQGRGISKLLMDAVSGRPYKCNSSVFFCITDNPKLRSMISIISYEDRFQPDFKRLNLEWLDRYHLTESHDLMVLDDPRGTIINRGGFIWLAEHNGVIVGSAGLIKSAEGFELAKMAVAPEYRGQGISKMLVETCLTKARELGADKLILFSNHQLVTAIKLYEKYGFKHIDVKDSPFETADVKMELLL